jgi:ketosteroid isomerase-like protein
MWERSDELWTDDVVYREDPRWPGADVFRGREAVVNRFVAYTQDIAGASADLREVEVAGDRAFCAIHVGGRGASSAAPTDHLWGYYVVLRDGRIAEIDAHLDPEEARGRLRDG